MQIPIQITYRGIAKSAALEAAIQKEADQLEEFFARITACRVTVSETQHHSPHRKSCSIHIALAVPGEELIANFDAPDDPAHADAHASVKKAFHICRRELQDYIRRLRGDVKTHAAPPNVATAGH